MLRTFAIACALLAALFLAGSAPAAKGKGKKNQMVKGTIKSVDVAKNLLVVNQKVKNEVVARELSINEETEFEVITGGEKKAAQGQDGLALLEGKEGSQVKVKCDKDVNVLKVTVRIKK
jgi:hypothetical protein